MTARLRAASLLALAVLASLVVSLAATTFALPASATAATSVSLPDPTGDVEAGYGWDNAKSIHKQMTDSTGVKVAVDDRAITLTYSMAKVEPRNDKKFSVSTGIGAYIGDIYFRATATSYKGQSYLTWDGKEKCSSDKPKSKRLGFVINVKKSTLTMKIPAVCVPAGDALTDLFFTTSVDYMNSGKGGTTGTVGTDWVEPEDPSTFEVPLS